MRFKKGSRVEVSCKKGVPSGFWRCAEIISGNGHTYTIRYKGHTGTIDDTIVERISRKAIRPCPPLPEIAENWVPGDVVEVFDDFSWKMATISKVLGKEYFLVRILGSYLEFKVSKFDIRIRQSWQADKWIVIGKGSGTCEDIKHDESSILKCKRNSLNNVQMTKTRLHGQVKDACFPVVNKKKNQESNMVSCRTLKRGHLAYKQEVCDGFIEAVDGYSSDAESFCQWRYEEENIPFPTKDELAAEIHRLELYAYRCTMEALYASGPLSWEQEALVTNLRLSLHISNDEHLMEVRNLVSADNSIPSR
ncbi:hypothetical protein GH714_041320 [Hevea brasiliensis]|uniref:ENT domain-containing protein n=1 Tax=Hevea brasiliensis TaxID=3981 RepID=A0A6A6MXX9_HEVBR|nr:hypothetical protein GH714_041320 [Hevea brasiliensis]